MSLVYFHLPPIFANLLRLSSLNDFGFFFWPSIFFVDFFSIFRPPCLKPSEERSWPIPDVAGFEWEEVAHGPGVSAGAPSPVKGGGALPQRRPFYPIDPRGFSYSQFCPSEFILPISQFRFLPPISRSRFHDPDFIPLISYSWVFAHELKTGWDGCDPSRSPSPQPLQLKFANTPVFVEKGPGPQPPVTHDGRRGIPGVPPRGGRAARGPASRPRLMAWRPWSIMERGVCLTKDHRVVFA